MDQELDIYGPEVDLEFEAFLDDVFRYDPELVAAELAYEEQIEWAAYEGRMAA